MEPIVALNQAFFVVEAFWGGLSVGGRVGAVFVALVLYVFSVGAAYGRWISRWPDTYKYHGGSEYSRGKFCCGNSQCTDCQFNVGAAAIVWPVVALARGVYFYALTPIGKAAYAIGKAGVTIASSGARLTAPPAKPKAFTVGKGE